MKVYKLSSYRSRNKRGLSIQYFLNREDAKRCKESYAQQGIKYLELDEIEAGPCLLKAGDVINDTDVAESLLGHTVNYNEFGHIIRAVIVRVRTTWPNIGLAVKPLEPSRCHFGVTSVTRLSKYRSAFVHHSSHLQRL